MSGSNGENRPCFFDHPLCKELNIGSLAMKEQESHKKKVVRSLERRCAMDFVITKAHTHHRNEETNLGICKELKKRRDLVMAQESPKKRMMRALEYECLMDSAATTQTNRSNEEKNPRVCRAGSPKYYAKNDTYYKNDRRPAHLRTLSPISVRDNDGIPTIACNSRASHECIEIERNSSCRRSSSTLNSSSNLPPFPRNTISSSLLTLEELDIVRTPTSVLGRPAVTRDNGLPYSNHASANESDPPSHALPSSVRNLLTSLKESGDSLFARLILGGDEEEPTDSQNVLLDEMQRMEDQNIWNTIRKRHYE